MYNIVSRRSFFINYLQENVLIVTRKVDYIICVKNPNHYCNLPQCIRLLRYGGGGHQGGGEVVEGLRVMVEEVNANPVWMKKV